MTDEGLAAFLDETLGTFDEVVLARGRAYARDGRVRVQELAPSRIQAIVYGTHPYAVDVEYEPGGGDVEFVCTCEAYARQAECKHIAALAFSLRRETADETLVPFVLREVRSAAAFLAR